MCKGSISFAIPEERVSRVKYSNEFPMGALNLACRWAKLEPADIHTFAIAWNPAYHIANKTRASISRWPAHPAARFFSNANHILPWASANPSLQTIQTFMLEKGRRLQIHFVDHHLCHAFLGLAASGYKSAAVLCLDGYGEKAACVIYNVGPKKLEKVFEVKFPDSLGLFYSAVTQHMGYKADHDEWKVMGAAAHGNPARFVKKLEKLIPSDSEQIFQMNKDFLNPQDNEHTFIWNKKANKLFGPPREKGARLSRRDFDLASAAQLVFEKRLIQAAKKAKKLTRQKNLIYTGGCAMNCLANASLRKNGVFEKMHVSFAPDDSGNSIGAALAVHSGLKRFNLPRIETTFYGPSFEDDDIYSLLVRMRLPCNRIKNPSKTAAEYLVRGKILGWFQGRSEFGQRALGNRSILANPRIANIKETLNLAIKMREGYRPFAPSVLKEFAGDYFDVVGDPTDYRFMGFTAKLRSQYKKELSSIVNIDGMSRIQVVLKQDNPLFHQLISSFKNETNIPMVINTSFNLDAEPIVCSPTDAIRTFYSSGLNALFLGSFILEK